MHSNATIVMHLQIDGLALTFYLHDAMQVAAAAATVQRHAMPFPVDDFTIP